MVLHWVDLDETFTFRWSVISIMLVLLLFPPLENAPELKVLQGVNHQGVGKICKPESFPALLFGDGNDHMPTA